MDIRKFLKRRKLDEPAVGVSPVLSEENGNQTATVTTPEIVDNEILMTEEKQVPINATNETSSTEIAILDEGVETASVSFSKLDIGLYLSKAETVSTELKIQLIVDWRGLRIIHRDLLSHNHSR